MILQATLVPPAVLSLVVIYFKIPKLKLRCRFEAR